VSILGTDASAEEEGRAHGPVSIIVAVTAERFANLRYCASSATFCI